MNKSAAPPRFSIGRVLIESLRFISRHPLQCLLLVAVMLPLIFVPPLVVDIDRPWFVHNGDWLLGVLSDCVLFMMSFLTSAAVTFPVLHHLRGRVTRADDWVRWIPALGRVAVGSPALWLFPVLGSIAMNYVANEHPDAWTLLILIWSASAIIAFAISAIWSVYTSLVVFEGASGFAGLVRSARLSRGRRWRILGLYLIIYVVQSTATIVLAVMVYRLSAPTYIHGNDWSYTAIVYGPLTFLAVLSAVVTATLYHQLRLEDEGMDSDKAVMVFD